MAESSSTAVTHARDAAPSSTFLGSGLSSIITPKPPPAAARSVSSTGRVGGDGSTGPKQKPHTSLVAPSKTTVSAGTASASTAFCSAAAVANMPCPRFGPASRRSSLRTVAPRSGTTSRRKLVPSRSSPSAFFFAFWRSRFFLFAAAFFAAAAAPSSSPGTTTAPSSIVEAAPSSIVEAARDAATESVMKACR